METGNLVYRHFSTTAIGHEAWSTRIKSGQEQVDLADDTRVVLKVSPRNRRPLLILDGQICPGFGSRSIKMLKSDPLKPLQCKIGRLYKEGYENVGLYGCHGEWALQDLGRYFMLLADGEFVFWMFNSRNLKPRYLRIVIRGGEFDEITFSSE